uniref:Calmodulin-lysine N-methyltransferase n=1 Tax=Amorphochlora amoebiformis TaxID=1561963 RepID=A0A7S0DPC2_9EUKA|mmetsp:Transcript_34382/g.55369  ORF Transcript_34382/g.55369 Transcript_34382/m.55369 type:complete len:276 (+) Transcript_34382:104-931(+)
MSNNQTETKNEQKQANNDPEWASKSLQKRCDCEMCRSGKATTHNDNSHDQSLDQKLSVGGVDIRIVGGTTKCARVTVKFFETKEFKSTSLKGKKVVEVGSGTGLVGTCLGLLGAEVTMTDQSYVMEVLQYNIRSIEKKAAKAKKEFRVTTEEHVWGSEISNLPACDIVVGSDLIFALEGIRPLVKSIKALVVKSIKEGRDPVVYVAVIRRFEWEKLYFELMDEAFTSETVAKEGDIAIYRYKWKPETNEKKESKQETSNTNSKNKEGSADASSSS